MVLAAYHIQCRDTAGNAFAGAHVEIRIEMPGQPKAAVYADRFGETALGFPFDVDANGFAICYLPGGSYQVRVYTGSSGSPTFEAPLRRYVAIGLNAEGDGIGVKTQRTVTAAGAVTITADDVDMVVIAKAVGAATTVNLPAAALRTKEIKIADGKHDAATNNITIVPDGSESIYGASSYVIDGNGGSVVLTPLDDGSGWL